ncbi:hypothetical protein D5282_16985 [bacterium 1xD8-48]|nr:hypothetical protein [bacterium 1xD8-48]
MINLRNITKRFVASLHVIICIVGCLQPLTMKVSAKETSIAVRGSIYEFASNTNYEFSSVAASSGTSFGTFTISGDLKNISNKNGLPAYSVSSESVNFYYSYDQSKLNVPDTEWYLIDDKTKKIDTISLEQNILSGVIIVQSSKDGVNWITDVTMTDVFTGNDDLSDSLYSTKGIQLENGCYYRVIVAYELQRKIGEGKILFITTEEKEEKKVAEVYEFYAVSNEVAGNMTSAAATPRKELGQKVNTGKDNGYSGNNAIDKDDPHYGWNLGTFVVNGYTRETSSNGTPVFLKNVGDKVTLWFTLTQDINNLNENSALTISEDTNGYDQYFEIAQTNFKRGTLIIQYTDHEGNSHAPVIYTDFLAANATTGADTRVQLFEEGDYEISLDYEIKNNPRQVGSVSVIPTYTNYKISFSFSIRNGNCMVYPFDTVTGAELSDRAITSNGFKLNMAKSRYLTIDVTRTVLNVGADGQLTEDVRFNLPAKDNDAYIDDGIYTFTVKNLYTGETTTKTIYVGTDKYLLALSKNLLTVDALNEKIGQDATINDDGSIVDYIPPEKPEIQPVVVVDTTPDDEVSHIDPADVSEPTTDEAPQSSSSTLFIAIVLVAIACGILIMETIMKKAKKKKEEDDA